MKSQKFLAGAGCLLIVTAGLIIFTTPGKELRGRATGTALDTYVACGCGACGGTEPREKILYSRSEFEDAKKQDKAVKGSPECAKMGCAICTKYVLKA